jgi:hypothetical protein
MEALEALEARLSHIGSSTLTNPTLTPTDRAGGYGAAPNLLKFFNMCFSKVAIPCPQSASCDLQRDSSELLKRFPAQIG